MKKMIQNEMMNVNGGCIAIAICKQCGWSTRKFIGLNPGRVRANARNEIIRLHILKTGGFGHGSSIIVRTWP